MSSAGVAAHLFDAEARFPSLSGYPRSRGYFEPQRCPGVRFGAGRFLCRKGISGEPRWYCASLFPVHAIELIQSKEIGWILWARRARLSKLS